MKNSIVVAAALMLSILINLASVNTYALPGGATWNKGYFNGLMIPDSTGFDKMLTTCGNSTPFDSSMTNKTTFINRLVSYYVGGCSGGRNSIGAMFIMLTMLNRPASAARSSGNDLITDWENYINGSGVGIAWMTGLTFNYNSGCYSNSGCDNGGEDEYFKNANRLGDSLVFYDTNSGGVLYALKYDCGNPVGYDNIPAILIPHWSISASSSVKVSGVATSTSKPGDTISWTHNLKNDGPNATSANIHSNLAIDRHNFKNNTWSGVGFPNGWGGSSQTEWAAGDNVSGAVVGTIRTISSYATYTVSQADVSDDMELCERVQYDPTDWRWTPTTYRDGRGNWSCVRVPYKYNLTPVLNINPSGKVEAGAVISIAPSVINSGPTNSRNTDWELTQILVDPDKNIPPGASGGASPKDPCGTYFKVPGIIKSCNTKAKGVAVFNANNTVSYVSGDQFQNSSDTVADLPAGSKECYSLAIKHYSEDSNINQWMNSDPICIIIVKKPKTQIWGGDLWSKASVRSSTSVKNIGGDHTFGSWVEYGIFSPATISGTASGSAFAGTTGLVGNNPICNYTMLTFTNAGTSSCNPVIVKGSYSNSHNIPNVSASFIGGVNIANGSSINPNTLIAGSGTYIGNVTGAGNLTLTDGRIQPGKTIVIKTNGTVTIGGDIFYYPNNNGVSYTNGYQLPQLIIIANKIIINGSVKNVDAWLVARGIDGTIQTCDDLTILTINKCKDKLIVNGPVMANHLNLRRTAGSGVGAASNDPAEVFNLRADAYLWAAAYAATSTHAQTVNTNELPARY